MPPSRGLLALSSVTRIKSSNQGLKALHTQRCFSCRPTASINHHLPAKSRTLLATQWTPIVVRANVPSTARSLSLWGWGSTREGSPQDGSLLTKPTPSPQVQSTSPTTPNGDSPVPITEQTVSTSTPATITPAAEDSTLATMQNVSFDSITPAVSDLTAIPEGIGYFHALGLDYGWGPTSCIEWLLEHVHVWSGTPWWGSILITAAIIRTAMVPLIIKQSDNMAKMGAMKEEMDKIRAKATDFENPGEQAKAMVEMRNMSRLVGFDPKWMYIPMVVQSVLGFCTFKFMRAGANVPVPGWESGGFAWITDLTITDPYYITPVIFAGVMHILGRLGGEAGAAQQAPWMRSAMLYFLPVVIGGTMFLMPVALQLSFLTSMIFGIGQSYALKQPKIRQRLGISPLYLPQTEAQKRAMQAQYAAPAHINLAPNARGTYSMPTQGNLRYQAPGASKQGYFAEKIGEIKAGTTDAREKMEKWMQSGKKASPRGYEFDQRAKKHEEIRRKEIAYQNRARRGEY